MGPQAGPATQSQDTEPFPAQGAARPCIPVADMDILRERLRNHHLLDPLPGTPADVVRSMGAVQAQDYGGARWAVAQRGRGLTAAAVDDALADGSVLRTHVLRPTWHLVTPADIGWVLTLTAPRIKAQIAYGNRESGLDDATLARSNRTVAKALRGGRQLTRIELADVLQRAGVTPRDGVGMMRLMVAAELDGVICSGALRGRQHTYALLEERVPASVVKARPAALAELASRYYASHGPATIKDFAWWSGLTVADAAAGARDAHPQLERTDLDGRTYWSAPTARTAAHSSPTAHLLANFDEYTVGYTDRSLLIDAGDQRHEQPRPELILSNVVTIDGRVVGTWKRSAQRNAVRVTLSMFAPVTARASAAITAAADQYAAFATSGRPPS
jgi:Winged helix DNA-binding domain